MLFTFALDREGVGVRSFLMWYGKVMFSKKTEGRREEEQTYQIYGENEVDKMVDESMVFGI